MHRDWIWIERVVCAAGGIDSCANESTDENIARHRRFAGCGRFALNSYALGDIARLAYYYRKIVPTAHHKFRGCDASFSRGKLDIRTGRLAQHSKLFMNAASDGGTGGKEEKWQG